MIISFHRIIYKATIILLLIILFSACSSTRFLYTFLEEFIKDEISFFFNLDKDERIFMNQQVSDMVYWHRSSMLPKYSDYLNNIAEKMEIGKYDDIDIINALTEGRYLIEETVISLTPYVSKFLIQHQSLEAIEFMEKQMSVRNQESLTKLSETEDILLEERIERLILNFERFLGDISDAQVTLLRDYALATLGDSKIRLSIRTQRQKVFLAFIRTQPTEAELTAHLNKLLLSNYAINNPDDKGFSEASVSRFRELVIKILSISSTSQIETIINKLRDYAEDFKEVSE